jgi:DNA-binding MarR family transcriptional regulator
MIVRNSSGGDGLPDHMLRWLEAVTQRLRAELAARTRGQGEFPGLRGSHRRVLQMIPPGGIRITDLAALAGMTKQSLGELADWLDESGFVTSRRDENDRRVRLVSRTRLGDAAAEATSRGIASVEERWREEIGPARYDAMKQVLRELGRDSFSR